jgi:FkbM family methyltransferase
MSRRCNNLCLAFLCLAFLIAQSQTDPATEELKLTTCKSGPIDYPLLFPLQHITERGKRSLPDVIALDVGANKGIVGVAFLQTWCSGLINAQLWHIIRQLGIGVLGWSPARSRKRSRKTHDKLKDPQYQAKFCPTVHFFELDQGTSEILARIRRVFYFPERSFNVHRLAMADKLSDGPMPVRAPAKYFRGMEQTGLGNGKNSTVVGEVNVTTLDEWTSSNLVKNSFITFIKIDTEGFDFMVLRGMKGILKRQGVQYLIFEWNKNLWGPLVHSPTPLADAVDFVTSFGYDVFSSTYAVKLSNNRTAVDFVQADSHYQNIFAIRRDDTAFRQLVELSFLTC